MPARTTSCGGSIRWRPSRPRVILTHGDDKTRDALHGIMAKRYGLDAERPALYDVIEV
jgi:hypothetical protein